jgi:hypothetical protein
MRVSADSLRRRLAEDKSFAIVRRAIDGYRTEIAAELGLSFAGDNGEMGGEAMSHISQNGQSARTAHRRRVELQSAARMLPEPPPTSAKTNRTNRTSTANRR